MARKMKTMDGNQAAAHVSYATGAEADAAIASLSKLSTALNKANRLQVVEINGKSCYNNKKIFLGRKLL